MDQEKFQAILHNLQQTLAAADKLDPESRKLLRQLTGDLEDLADSAGQTDDHHQSISERLEEAMLHFEAEHPKLSQAIADVSDALTKLGI